MLPIDNPFRPAPGSEPPALVGRDEESGAAQYSMRMTATGAPAQPIVFTGLRGMGKTALLRHCIAEADENAIVIHGEGSADEPLHITLQRGLAAAQAQNASLPTRLKHGFDKILEALPRASYDLPNDLGSVSLARGAQATSTSLTATLDEVNTMAHKHGRFLVFALDEIQDAPVEGLRDLVRFVHASAGTTSPAFLLAAGLPSSREHLHVVRTYTERWRYFRLELLTPQETQAAIAIPAESRRVTIESDALSLLVSESAGYPFFVQEFASAAWLAHAGSRITLDDVQRSIPGVRRILDDTFYDARFSRLTPREIAYVLALADLGPGQHSSGEIANTFGQKSPNLASIRNQLIKKDVIYSPISGMAEFRIPLTDRYVRGRREEFERRASGSSIQRES